MEDSDNAHVLKGNYFLSLFVCIWLSIEQGGIEEDTYFCQTQNKSCVCDWEVQESSSLLLERTEGSLEFMTSI